MHNMLALGLTNTSRSVLQSNTFSGQPGGSLWETRAQTRRLSPTTYSTQNSLWESLGIYTQQAVAACTVFPTARAGKTTLSKEHLSPQSTGPIEKTTKYIKEIRS